MNRSDFLKTLGLGSTGLIIANTTWSQKPVKIYDNYVKGLSHYHFAAVRKQLVLGQELILKWKSVTYTTILQLKCIITI